MKCSTRCDSKRQRIKSGALAQHQGYSLAEGSGASLCLFLGLLSLIFLAGCHSRRLAEQEEKLQICYALANQCDRIVDMCIHERKESHVRMTACDQIGNQLVKCLDKNERRKK